MAVQPVLFDLSSSDRGALGSTGAARSIGRQPLLEAVKNGFDGSNLLHHDAVERDDMQSGERLGVTFVVFCGAAEAGCPCE